MPRLPFGFRSGSHRPLSLIVLCSVDLRAVLLTLAAVLLTAGSNIAYAQSLSGFDYNGQVYTSYQANEYEQTPQGPQGTAAIRDTGASYGSVVVTQYEQTYTSSTIAPETVSSPGYDSSRDPLSPTDAAVVAAIQNMHAQGITVFLKPQVDSLDGMFRGQFAPANVADWFASYQTFILHYAALAAQNGVGGLIIGTELASLTKSAYRSYWLDIIAQLRSSYPNLTLAYGANATYSGDEFTTVSFWDKVDIIGVDGYFPLTDHADPTVAELVASWSDNRYGFNAVAALKSLQSTYNKPLIFTELGYVSAAGTNETPYASAAAGAAYDPTEQNNCYEAFFEVFSQEASWMKGVFWWAWNVSPPGNADTGYTPQNKTAADTTLVKWYGASTQGFTLAPSTSVLALGQGAQVPATISVTSLGGFSGSVLLTATGLPAGVTASFAAGAAAGTQVMTLSSTASATAGSATITITGTSGSLLATTGIALTVQGASAQTISFAAPPAQIVGKPLTLSATASSGLTVTFASETSAVCTVAGNVATFLEAGTCTIDANQAGNSAYSAAPQVQQSFSVAAAPSFTIAAATPALSVAQGASGTDAITITAANGFNGNVTLSASGLPAGVTAVFSMNPANSSSVATFTVSSTAAVGTATVTIAGTSGALTASTVINLSISAPPSFSLTAASPALSVTPGSSVQEAISIVGISGFVGTVNLAATVTSSPQAAVNPPTLSFGATNPATVTSAGGSTTLTISTTVPAVAELHRPTHRSGMWEIGGTTLACVILFSLPGRGRRRTLLFVWPALLSVLVGITGCGDSGKSPQPARSPGTTLGTYIITVTATSSTVTATLPVTVNVQ